MTSPPADPTAGDPTAGNSTAGNSTAGNPTRAGSLPDGATRAWLDAQYDARALADADAILADWASRSATVRAAHPPIEVRYGEHPRQAADVYGVSPDGGAGPDGGARPLVVFVHGGYWRSLDKETFAFLAPPFLAAPGTGGGAVFASLDYRLVPEVALADVVADVRAGVAELVRRAGALGVDPHRVVVVGHSAGGHLVGMLMATDWAAHGLAADVVARGVIAAGVGISGLYDLEPIRHSYLNDVLALTADDARAASPVLATPTAPGPLLLTCGGDEPGEFDRQQRLLVSSWPGVETMLLGQDGGNHFDACGRLAEPGPFQDAVLALVARV